MEVIPAVSMALFAGHIVDQKEEKLISQMHFGFSVISFVFFIDMAGGRRITAKRFFIYSTTFFFGISSGFLRTNHLFTIILTRS
jgi:hypothetical protein